MAKDRQFGLVVTPDGGTVQIRFNTIPAHRADIPLDNIGDMAACGMPGGDWVVRCGKQQKTDGMTVIGSATEALMDRVRHAIEREAYAEAWEAKYAGPFTGEFNAAIAMRMSRGCKQRRANISA
jgi:hypothetical protein